MKKIIIYAIGTYGDIYPLLGIAKELLNRNFNVCFLSNDKFQSIIEHCNINYKSVGKREDYDFIFENPLFWKAGQDVLELDSKDYLKSLLEKSYRYVEECYLKGEDLFIISLDTNLNNGVRMAADKYLIPQALISLYPAKFMSSMSPPAPMSWFIPNWIPTKLKPYHVKFIYGISGLKFMRKPHQIYLKNMRKKLAVKPTYYKPNYDYKSENLLIGFFPEWYGICHREWPKNLNLVGFPLFDTADNQNNAKIDEFIAKTGAPIVFTSGTGVSRIDEFFSESYKVCKLLNLPGIFVGGKDFFLEDDSQYIHVPSVSFEYLLPQCRAIVHHGGIGTVSQAIRAGIPQLIRPLTFDQPDNATRVTKLGLGSFILPVKYEAETVANRLKVLIDGASNNRRLKYFSENLKHSNAIKHACDLIEQNMHQSKKEKSSLWNRLMYSINALAVKSPIKITQDKKTPSLACISAILSIHGTSVSVNYLRKKFPLMLQQASLKDIIDVFKSYNYTSAAFQCEAEDLSSVKLPCLVLWNFSRFVVLTHVDGKKYFILNPDNNKTAYTDFEFKNMYGGIALEIVSNE